MAANVAPSSAASQWRHKLPPFLGGRAGAASSPFDEQIQRWELERLHEGMPVPQLAILNSLRELKKHPALGPGKIRAVRENPELAALLPSRQAKTIRSPALRFLCLATVLARADVLAEAAILTERTLRSGDYDLALTHALRQTLEAPGPAAGVPPAALTAWRFALRTFHPGANTPLVNLCALSGLHGLERLCGMPPDMALQAAQQRELRRKLPEHTGIVKLTWEALEWGSGANVALPGDTAGEPSSASDARRWLRCALALCQAGVRPEDPAWASGPQQRASAADALDAQWGDLAERLRVARRSLDRLDPALPQTPAASLDERVTEACEDLLAAVQVVQRVGTLRAWSREQGSMLGDGLAPAYVELCRGLARRFEAACSQSERLARSPEAATVQRGLRQLGMHRRTSSPARRGRHVSTASKLPPPVRVQPASPPKAHTRSPSEGLPMRMPGPEATTTLARAASWDDGVRRSSVQSLVASYYRTSESGPDMLAARLVDMLGAHDASLERASKASEPRSDPRLSHRSVVHSSSQLVASPVPSSSLHSHRSDPFPFDARDSSLLSDAPGADDPPSVAPLSLKKDLMSFPFQTNVEAKNAPAAASRSLLQPLHSMPQRGERPSAYAGPSSMADNGRQPGVDAQAHAGRPPLQPSDSPGRAEAFGGVSSMVDNRVLSPVRPNFGGPNQMHDNAPRSPKPAPAPAPAPPRPAGSVAGMHDNAAPSPRAQQHANVSDMFDNASASPRPGGMAGVSGMFDNASASPRPGGMTAVSGMFDNAAASPQPTNRTDVSGMFDNQPLPPAGAQAPGQSAAGQSSPNPNPPSWLAPLSTMPEAPHSSGPQLAGSTAANSGTIASRLRAEAELPAVQQAFAALSPSSRSVGSGPQSPFTAPRDAPPPLFSPNLAPLPLSPLPSVSPLSQPMARSFAHTASPARSGTQAPDAPLGTGLPSAPSQVASTVEPAGAQPPTGLRAMRGLQSRFSDATLSRHPTPVSVNPLPDALSLGTGFAATSAYDGAVRSPSYFPPVAAEQASSGSRWLNHLFLPDARQRSLIGDALSRSSAAHRLDALAKAMEQRDYAAAATMAGLGASGTGTLSRNALISNALMARFWLGCFASTEGPALLFAMESAWAARQLAALRPMKRLFDAAMRQVQTRSAALGSLSRGLAFASWRPDWVALGEIDSLWRQLLALPAPKEARDASQAWLTAQYALQGPPVRFALTSYQSTASMAAPSDAALYASAHLLEAIGTHLPTSLPEPILLTCGGDFAFSLRISSQPQWLEYVEQSRALAEHLAAQPGLDGGAIIAMVAIGKYQDAGQAVSGLQHAWGDPLLQATCSALLNFELPHEEGASSGHSGITALPAPARAAAAPAG